MRFPKNSSLHVLPTSLPRLASFISITSSHLVMPLSHTLFFLSKRMITVSSPRYSVYSHLLTHHVLLFSLLLSIPPYISLPVPVSSLNLLLLISFRLPSSLSHLLSNLLLVPVLLETSRRFCSPHTSFFLPTSFSLLTHSSHLVYSHLISLVTLICLYPPRRTISSHILISSPVITYLLSQLLVSPSHMSSCRLPTSRH